MENFKLFIAFLTTLIPASISLLLLSTSVSKITNARYIEVIFYGKNGASKAAAARRKRSTVSEMSDLSLSSQSSTTNNNVEKIKVGVEDLNNFSRYEYCEKSSQSKSSEGSSNGNDCTWKKFTTLEGSNGNNKSKYYFLGKIAKYFLSIQHSLNLLKGLKIEKNTWKVEDELKECTSEDCQKCEDCCKTKDGKCCCLCFPCKDKEKKCCSICTTKDKKLCIPCCLLCKKQGEECECKEKEKCCLKNFSKNQKKFFFSLKNVSGITTNNYLSVLQAHINLPDIDFEKDLKNAQVQENGESGGQTKTLFGTTVYGYTDYYYQEQDKMPELKDEFKRVTGSDLNGSSDSSDSSCQNQENCKYFVNLPLSFNFTVSGINGEKKEEAEAQTCPKYKLLDVYNKLNDKKLLIENFKSVSSQTTQLSSSSNVEDDINCLLSRNYVLLSSKLEDAKCLVECKENCKDFCTQEIK